MYACLGYENRLLNNEIMFNWPILIYGQTGFPVRPKSWPDIGQLSGQSDIRPNSTFFYFQKQGCQIFILKIPFFMFQLNHIHSVGPRTREFSRVSGRIWRKWILWKKMEIFRKSWQPCHNTTVTKLVQQSILISKTCIHSKFQ